MRILPWARLRRHHRIVIEHALAWAADDAIRHAEAASGMTAASWLDHAIDYLDAAPAVSGPLGAQPGSAAALREQRKRIAALRARAVAEARFRVSAR